jgi:anti-sigma factor RsiW
MNVSSSHLSVETLTDLAEDRLGAEPREAALAHIATCSACDKRVLELRELIRTMSSDRPEDAPAEILNAAIDIFSRQLQPTTASSLRRIVAILTFDSFKSIPAFGMRSGQTASRQLLYSA